MSRRGPFNLNWPWHWLRGDSNPGDYLVPQNVVPTVDVAQHNHLIQSYEETFAMAAGVNVVILPGFLRAASLNPAALPIINFRGARRWLALTFETDTATVAPTRRLAYVRAPASPAPDLGNSIVNLQIGRQDNLLDMNQNAMRNIGNPTPYVPDPYMLRFSITGQAGTETITLRGIFLESDSDQQPLPNMFR